MEEVLKNSIHEKFAQGIADGMKPHAAYIQAHGECSKATALKQAKRWMQFPDIHARVEVLKQQNAEQAQWKRADSIEILRTIALNADMNPHARVKAVSVLNDMCGFTGKEPDTQTLIHAPFSFICADNGVPT